MISVGVMGFVVVYCGGVNLSCIVGDIFVLMKVEGLKGVDVKIDVGILVGCNGYVVIIYV